MHFSQKDSVDKTHFILGLLSVLSFFVYYDSSERSENPMEGGTWWAAVHGVAQSWTQLHFHFHFSLSRIGEGNGNPLQCSCLENPRDGGAWWTAIYGVAQSQIWLKRLSSSSSYLHWKSFAPLCYIMTTIRPPNPSLPQAYSTLVPSEHFSFIILPIRSVWFAFLKNWFYIQGKHFW